jgi:hypothetical protein
MRVCQILVSWTISQLTHSLKASGFNLWTYQMRNWFQTLAFECDLYRYRKGGASLLLEVLVTAKDEDSDSDSSMGRVVCSFDDAHWSALYV